MAAALLGFRVHCAHVNATVRRRQIQIVNGMLRALLVTPDSLLVGMFADLSRELGIEAQSSVSTNGIPDELRSAKYEAVLLDYDRVPDASTILTTLRKSP